MNPTDVAAPPPQAEAITTPAKPPKPKRPAPERGAVIATIGTRLRGFLPTTGQLVMGSSYGVAVAAAALSFETEYQLARLVGYGPDLSYGFPLVIDLYALVASLVWFGWGDAGPKLKRMAVGSTIFAVILSVTCNALYHALVSGLWAQRIVTRTMAAQGLVEHVTYKVNVEVIVPVSALAPVVLALTVHLITLISHGRKEASGETIPAPVARPRQDDQPIVVDGRPAAPRPEQLPAPRPSEQPALPAAPTKPAAEKNVVPIGQASNNKARAYAAFATAEQQAEGLARKGLNQELVVQLGIPLRSIELYKAQYKKDKATGTPQASGGAG